MAKSGSTGSLVALALDRASDVPLNQQILIGMRGAIANGQLPPRTKLPSTRSLAEEWSVSRNTVVAVFEALSDEGYLTSRIGDGTYVADVLPEDTRAVATSTKPALSGQGYPFRHLSQRGRTLIEQSFGGLSERPQPFMPDVPDLRAFPIRTWLRLMNETSGRLTGDILAEVGNAGYEPLRHAIAHHVKVARGVECSAHQVIITTGSQQSLDLVCRLLLDRGDPVWIEEPGYIGARASIAANGCAVMPVPVDGAGMDIECGARLYPTPRLVFVSPSRQYPLGVTMSLERRAELIALSHKIGAWILEDDYDCEFRYAGRSLPAVQSMDADGRVIYIGTFSKTLLPSFRLGYLIVPTDLAEDFACARAVIDRHPPLMEQMALAEFMHRGLFAAHVRRMRSLYRSRQQVMLATIERELGVRLETAANETGMHVIVPLREEIDDRAFVQDMRGRIVARPLSIYFAGRSKPRGILLGFAAFAEDEIERRGSDLRVLREALPRG